MASPFSIFRKHQKVALAAITILAMFAFVFMGPFSRGNNGPRTGKDTELVTWKFGSITRSDVDNRIFSRRAVNEFCKRAYIETLSKGGFPDGGYLIHFVEDNRSVLDAIILHKKAEQMGIVVSDDAIKNFIDHTLTDGQLSEAEKGVLLGSVKLSGNSFSQVQMFEALRFELETARLIALLRSDVDNFGTPEQRYDYFSRLYRSASIQVMPVAVKEFVGKVPDPDARELEAFFEKYKDDFSHPESPEPGFKEPIRANFQYFVASRQDLIKKEKPKVTDAEIKEYYEQHKELLFRKHQDDEGTGLPVIPKTPDTTAPKDSSGKPAEKTDKTEKPADKTDKTDDKAGKTDKPADKATGTKPDSGNAGGLPDLDEKPTETKPGSGNAPKAPQPGQDAGKTETGKLPMPTEKAAPDKQNGEKKDGDKKDDSAKKSSLLIPPLRQRPREELLALAEGDPAVKPAVPPVPAKDAAPPAKSDAPPPAKDAANPPPFAPAAPATPSKDVPPSTDKSPEKTPGANKVDNAPLTTPPKVDEPAKSGAQVGTPEETNSGKTDSTKTDPTKGATLPDLGLKPVEATKKIPIVEYESLDDPKIREQIATSIAGDKANEQINGIYKKLSPDLTKYSSKLSKWRAKQEGAKPTPPDFQTMAKDNGLTLQETGLISLDQARSSNELGKSQITVDLANGRRSQYPFWASAYTPNLSAYKPQQSSSADGEAEFLSWRVDYKEAFVPKFDDVKAEVLNTWKMIQARKLARAQAKEYADEANARNVQLQSLELQFPKAPKAISIESFTWMKKPAVARDDSRQPQVGVSKLSGIDIAGDDFMRAVFSLEPGKAGVAMNQQKTEAYAVQLIGFTNAEDMFRNVFLQHMAIHPLNDESFATAQFEQSDALRAKVDAINSEFDVKYLRDDSAAESGRAPLAGDEGDD